MPSTTTFNYEMKSHEAQAGEYGEESAITQVRHIWRKDLAAYQIDKDSTTAESEGALPRRGDPPGEKYSHTPMARIEPNT